MKKVYRGFIDFSEDGIGLSLENSTIDLIKEIGKDLDKYGRYVYVTYMISDVEQSEEEMLTSYLSLFMGIAHSEVHYAMGSEWTGEYCNGAELRVGGHDLHNELCDYYGKFLQLNIEYYEHKVEDVYMKGNAEEKTELRNSKTTS